MTTTVAKSTAVLPPMRWGRRRTTTVALTLAGLAVGTWLLIGGGGQSAAQASAATPVLAWAPIPAPWDVQLGVADLTSQLAGAGYQIRLDGRLGPVTKSAAADYLLPGSSSSLAPALARALSGTVFLGRRDPVDWNFRFGLHRPDKFVELPLTGPGGQLDANGNIRSDAPKRSRGR